jgi:PAS domain S-box-containing protein
MMAGVTLWSLANMMEMVNDDLNAKYVWICVQYLGIVTVPAAFMCFALEYTGRDFDRRRANIILGIVPALTVAAVWTNPWTNLYYTSQEAALIGDMVAVQRAYGPAFYVWLAFTYVVLGAALIIMVKAMMASHDERRRQLQLIIGASIVPWLFNIAYVALAPQRYIDLTLYGFAIAGVAMFIAFFRYDLFDVAPIARSSVVESMDDAVVVMDQNGRVVDANLAAASLAGQPIGRIIGHPLAEGFASMPEIVKAIAQSGEGIPTDILERGRYYEVRSFALRMTSQRPLGKVAVMRDVTERRHKDSALAAAHERIDLLNSVTRQDILNMSMAISGFAALLDEQVQGARQKEYVARIKRSALNIEGHVRFTKEYLELGGNMPSWQNVPELLRRAFEASDIKDLQLNVNLGRLEVFADPLISKVLFIIADNIARHAKGATRVDIGYDISYGELKLILEDDGPGIPREEKEAVFERNYGKNTGYGLFFARQILQLTGFAIIENGAEGKGARFEISVPQGSYRILPEGNASASSP